MTLTENEIIDMNSYKEKVKANTRKLAFNDLKEMQKPHSKVNTIKYSSFQAQPYIKSHIMNNEEISLLFSLRCRTVRTIKANFSTIYK